MAELLMLCGRNGVTDTYTDADLETVVTRILPKNAPRKIEVIRNDGLITCTINAPDSLPIHGTSAAVGRLLPPTDDWHEPGAPTPDGSYGIIRADQNCIELVSDVTASRTIYYRHFEDRLVASTSQRAIAHFANDFVPNEDAIAWMISSGSLSPSQAWDERLNYVGPDTRVQLDRSTWELTEKSRRTTFDPIDGPESSHHDRLVDALDDTFNAININIERWELPLSGGLDSRELLLRLQDRKSLRTFTWGTNAALDDPETDAMRARELAEACDVPHRYYTLPETPENAAEVFDRFVTAGEGRIDHISGYLDGFGVFEDLSNMGVDGLIRGDEGFGWRPVGSTTAVRDVIGAVTIKDYEMLPALSIPGGDNQELPWRLARRDGESIATWRDRLYHTYRIPVVLGALTALKTPYVEVVNPFLTRRVLETVREFPDEYRTDKRLYAAYVENRCPGIPVATKSANPDGNRMLATEASRSFLRSELDTAHARSVLGTELVEHALSGLAEQGEPSKGRSRVSILDMIKRRIGSQLPLSVIRRIEEYTPLNRPSRSMIAERLAFRAYIVQSMNEKINTDINAL